MLHLDPQSVRLDRAVIGNVEPISILLDDIIRGGVGAVSPSGVLGDPTNASATEGIRVLQAMTDDVLDRINTNTPDLHGLLQTQPPKADHS
jgi:creatinine amidohydrolase